MDQSMDFEACTSGDAHELAELRARAMKPGLQQVGRFDEERVRSRFLDSFVPQDTKKVMIEGVLVGFFAVKHNRDHLYLDHLYVEPGFQRRGVGRAVIDSVLRQSEQLQLPVRLGALRQSSANLFYQSLGFVSTHEDACDIYYEYAPKA